MRRDVSRDGEARSSGDGASSNGGSDTPFIVIFTDLDGTLLDHDTYEWREARPALELCKRLRVPVVMVSSKTRAEMEGLRRELQWSAPYISENGGGIFFPEEGVQDPPQGAVPEAGGWKVVLGCPYDDLLKALREIGKELGYPVRGFSEMSVEEISERTGLGHEAASLAAVRDYDEPFVLEGGVGRDPSALDEAARSRGLKISKGGRFYHLHGRNDKAEAVRRVLSWYRKKHPHPVSVALGDSPNDLTMLRVVDYPVLVRSDRPFPIDGEDIPGLTLTREKGPRGWNRAVLDILTRYGG